MGLSFVQHCERREEKEKQGPRQRVLGVFVLLTGREGKGVTEKERERKRYQENER